jgi:hypothetical protein
MVSSAVVFAPQHWSLPWRLPLGIKQVTVRHLCGRLTEFTFRQRDTETWRPPPWTWPVVAWSWMTAAMVVVVCLRIFFTCCGSAPMCLLMDSFYIYIFHTGLLTQHQPGYFCPQKQNRLQYRKIAKRSIHYPNFSHSFSCRTWSS